MEIIYTYQPGTTYTVGIPEQERVLPSFILAMENGIYVFDGQLKQIYEGQYNKIALPTKNLEDLVGLTPWGELKRIKDNEPIAKDVNDFDGLYIAQGNQILKDGNPVFTAKERIDTFSVAKDGIYHTFKGTIYRNNKEIISEDYPVDKIQACNGKILYITDNELRQLNSKTLCNAMTFACDGDNIHAVLNNFEEGASAILNLGTRQFIKMPGVIYDLISAASLSQEQSFLR